LIQGYGLLIERVKLTDKGAYNNHSPAVVRK
jgi:hypothetical protein